MANSTSPFILIVDDNATNLSVLSKTLKSANYKVRMAVDGEEALAMVAYAHPDLILLDVQMPKMDGFEACRRLQADRATQGIPVIFMTALADTENKVKGLSLGAVDYITKPFEPQEVLARVKVHWRLKQLTDTLEQQVAERTHDLQKTQLQLVQREKLSTLGQLVAGVAHEINNPISCVVGNVSAVQDSINDLFGLLDLYHQQFPQPGPTIEAELDTIDLEYLREDLPKLIKAMKDGGDRITSISKSLRTFCRADSDQKQLFNLHEGIDSTVLILRHRLKANELRPAIEVIANYGDVPAIKCFPGQLNQVFMNILANAIDALDAACVGRTYAELQAEPGRIIISTQLSIDLDTVAISIKDNGSGMSDSVKSRIFDHLFTTKEVGKGTGLGLAIARQIVIDTHSGMLEVSSILGQGTEFTIFIPC
ncbi:MULTISPECIES: response regulator [unclassified Microcoleus]|uniref:hybrid sensor histidine kinase/response regulator n=1 Tax=unclassified Microcoleus TaxID=2642155 RepID=UPI002FD01FD1